MVGSETRPLVCLTDLLGSQPKSVVLYQGARNDVSARLAIAQLYLSNPTGTRESSIAHSLS